MTNVIINIAVLGASVAFLVIRARAYVKYLKPEPNDKDASPSDPQTFAIVSA